MSTRFWLGVALGRQIARGLRPAHAAPTGRADEGTRSAASRAATEPRGTASPHVSAPTESDRIARFMERFCYVRDDYARQWRHYDPARGAWDHGWTRVGKSQPQGCMLTPSVVEAHLRGSITAGTYLLDAQNHCRLLVLDHDDKRILPEIDPQTAKQRVLEEDGLLLLQDCRERFAEQGIDSALVESRRGGHLFVFLDEPVEARDARALAFIGLGSEEAERMHQGQQAFEIYPKQDRRASRDGAVGSNIALPLGVHLKDGQRYPFVDHHGQTAAHTLSGQLDYLETIARCPAREVLRMRPWLYDELDRAMHAERPRERVLDDHPARSRTSSWERPRERILLVSSRPSLIAQWKAGVDCRDIVRAYGIDLNENGVGRCPFHDDAHASFQAWHDGWRCYAEGRGGDALHFVMEQERLTAREALAVARTRFPVPGLGHHEPSGRA